MSPGHRYSVLLILALLASTGVASELPRTPYTAASAVITVEPAGVAKGALLSEPAPPRPDSKYARAQQERNGQLRTPFVVEEGPESVSPVAPTEIAESVVSSSGAGAVPLAPGTFRTILSGSHVPANGSVSPVAEPSTGSTGRVRFETFNWFAAVATENGASRQYVDPYTMFPQSPAAFAAGFCCDQRVTQDASRGMVAWLLQYIKTSSTTTGTNGVRLAVATSPAALASNSWTYWDFTPAQVGLSGVWFDFPHMQVSANQLYFTFNIFNSANDQFYGAIIVRIPLAELAAGGTINFRYLVTQTYGSIMPINGAGAEGTRPGRTTMHFGAVTGTNSIVVITWPESSTNLTFTPIGGLASTSYSGFVCTAPDGTNPCARANVRMQGGWVTGNDLGFAWNSGPVGTRTRPFTRVAVLNATTLGLLSQLDIWNNDFAWLYPAFAVSARGHIGGTIDLLGGNRHNTVAALINDEFSPPIGTSGWESYSIANGNAGANQWGDYNAVSAHQRYPATWLGVGRVRDSSAGFPSQRLISFWYGRERDVLLPLTLTRNGTGTGTVQSSPFGINCGATCSNTFTVGTRIQLTASPAAGSVFSGWSGACSGIASCTVDIAAAATVNARFEQTLVFANGFE